jgi:hypothetical protein
MTWMFVSGLPQHLGYVAFNGRLRSEWPLGRDLDGNGCVSWVYYLSICLEWMRNHTRNVRRVRVP